MPVGESGSSFFSNGLVSTGLVKPVCEEDKMPLNGPTANFAHIFYQSQFFMRTSLVDLPNVVTRPGLRHGL